MRKASLLLFVAALALGAAFSAAVSAQTIGESGEARASSPDDFAHRLLRLRLKYPEGGSACARAIEHLIVTEPAAIAAVVAIAADADPAQKLAFERGIVSAEGLMRQSDPKSARQVQAYLDANKSSAVVVETSAAAVAPASVVDAASGGAGTAVGFTDSGSGHCKQGANCVSRN